MSDVFRLSTELRESMRGRTWHDDPRCPPFDSLRLVRPRFVDFAGTERVGELIVALEVADELARMFEELLRIRFPIRRMSRVDEFDGDDAASMEADNASGFNFRTIPGSNVLSHHALGLAVDINPRENPMIVDGVVHPPSAAPFVDRSHLRPGMFVEGASALAIFRRRGWHWGGDWSDLRDYHHFSKRARGA